MKDVLVQFPVLVVGGLGPSRRRMLLRILANRILVTPNKFLYLARRIQDVDKQQHQKRSLFAKEHLLLAASNKPNTK